MIFSYHKGLGFVNCFFRSKPFGMLWIFMVLCSYNNINAQHDSEYTTYMYNTMVLNPAYAGNSGTLKFRSQYRAQWVGVDGAPEVFNFSMDTPIGLLNKTGLGVSFSRSKIGPSSESAATFNYSYTLFLGSEKKVLMSFGIMAGLTEQNIDYSTLVIRNPVDGRLRDNVAGRISPIGGLGFFLHDDEKWYMGLSLPNMLSAEYYDDFLQASVDESISSYVMGGYVIDLNNEWKLKPAILGRFSTDEPLIVNVSGNFTYNDLVTIGAAYRLQSDNSFASIVSFQVSPRFMVGYSYDIVTGALEGNGLRSHEVFLSYSIGVNKKILGLPRLY